MRACFRELPYINSYMEWAKAFGFKLSPGHLPKYLCRSPVNRSNSGRQKNQPTMSTSRFINWGVKSWPIIYVNQADLRISVILYSIRLTR